MKIYYILFGFSAILSLFVSTPQEVHANPSYTVAPLVIDIDAEPRDIIERTITITNTGTAPLTLYPTVNNISMDEGGTITEFVQRVMSDATASLSAWIEIRRGGVKLPLGGSVTVPVIFRIHPQPKAGVYHAFIGFGYGRNGDEAKAMVDAGRAPGVIATVNIEDKVNRFLKLSQFIIDRFVTSPDNQAITYTVTNPGDEPMVPSGEIIVYNNKGVEVASVPVNPEGDSIPVGETHEFITTAPVDGLLGKYKAYLSVEYGTTQMAALNDTTFFYAFPLRTILLFFGALLVVIIFFSLYVHKRYLDDDDDDDVDHLQVRVNASVTEAKDHDINLKQQ